MFASVFFFFNDTATTEIYTLSLHDALPIALWPLPDRQGIPFGPANRAQKDSVDFPANLQRLRGQRRSRGVNGCAAQRKFDKFKFVIELVSRFPQNGCRSPRDFRPDAVSREQNDLLLHGHPRAHTILRCERTCVKLR